MSDVLKQEYIRKWEAHANNWRDYYCKVLTSGWFQWFPTPQSPNPERSVYLPSVAAFLAYGDIVKRVPGVPGGLRPQDFARTIGIPFEANPRTEVAFFVCRDDVEMRAWMDAIFRVMQQPMPGQQQPAPAPYGPAPGMPPYPPATTAPPYSGGPPPAGYPPQQPPAGYPPQPGYPPAPNPAYPTQGPAPGYPPQGGYPPPPQGGPGYPPQPGPGGYMAPGQFVQQGQPQYQQAPQKKGFNPLAAGALGAAGGLATGYLASNLLGSGGGFGSSFGGGWGGHGSHSSSDQEYADNNAGNDDFGGGADDFGGGADDFGGGEEE